MKKIKIVHIEDRFHPEMGYQLNFTAKFHSQKFEMHIITADSLALFGQNLSKDALKEKDRLFEEEHNVTIHRLPVLYEKKQGYNLLLKGVVAKIDQLAPDVLFIHALESYTGLHLLNKRSFYKKYMVCTDTHTLLNQFNNSLPERIYFSFHKKTLIKKLRKYNTPVFYTANENKNILIEKYGLAPSQVFPYLIGTDSNLFYPNKESGIELRKKLAIPEGNKVIIYAGKFNKPKSPHLVIDALKYLKGLSSKITLVMVGGKTEPYYSNHFLKIEEFVSYQIIIKDAIKVSELNSYYNMADLAVFPKENTLSALDVQLCKLPVVMEADNTNTERLQAGGLMYTKNDVSDLANKMEQLISNDEYRMQLGNSGYEFISANFTYQSIIKEMEQTIENHLS
ncbi:glycosyltransferase family 4 protein [Carboxylicivirga linearis]|uniref:Glycosyltransferase family 4 protein n=1 Tax=Carboxylicivirga linearis TaxID=1628157 RepID=A0ABS5JV41_9BACT|nr:glycosyltransferase family 4 protein [Carboxylicivirga linearis]MBS2098742.1 glycosyltransferase family 4 protein [Carboxylicivirga linearis]